MASQSILRLLRSRAPQIRSFTQTTPLLAARPSRTPPPIPRFGPPKKTAPKKAPTKTQAPPHVAPPPPAPRPTPAQIKSTLSTPQTYALGLLGDSESLLLYKAPRNIALFVSSFATGSLLSFWVASVAHGVFMEYTAPWYGKLVVLAGCLLSSSIGIAMLITPHHLVKSISIVKAAEKQVVLRVKGTRFFPFRKQATFDLVPGELMVDSNVTMSLESGRGWGGVDLEHGKAWTQGSLQRPARYQGNIFQRVNQRMLNIGPAIFSQVRKMFNREGMMYARIGSSNWKMDLSDCEILENGTVLMKLCREGAIRTTLMDMAMVKVLNK